MSTRGLCQISKYCHLLCQNYKRLSLRKYCYSIWPPNKVNLRIWGDRIRFQTYKVLTILLWCPTFIIIGTFPVWDNYTFEQAKVTFLLETSLFNLWNNNLHLNLDNFHFVSYSNTFQGILVEFIVRRKKILSNVSVKGYFQPNASVNSY